jgi:hypothetical protein
MAKTRIRMRKYKKSAKGKAALDRYEQSGDRQAAKDRYNKSEEGKAVKAAAQARYEQSAKGKAALDRYREFDAERSETLLNILGDGVVPNDPSLKSEDAATAVREIAKRTGLKASKGRLASGIQKRREAQSTHSSSHTTSTQQGLTRQLTQTMLAPPQTQQEAENRIEMGRQMMASGYNYSPVPRPVTPRGSWSGTQYTYTERNGNHFNVTDHRAPDGARNAQWYNPQTQRQQGVGESQRKPNAQYQNED